MNREQLQNIFRQSYSADKWQELLINLFGASEIRETPSFLTSDSNEKVEGFELGRLHTSDHYEIGLFAFEIKQGHNLKLNRVGLRSLVRSYTRHNVDAALVVYYDATHWRLSFICDIKDQKTSPKRYTYVFGNTVESYRTAADRLSKLTDTKPNFEQIKDAFSVEKLSKDFFKGYKDQYSKFCKHIGGEQKWQRDYVKKMMGRLVFLQFLQKKGWMGCGATQTDNLPQWGDGDLQYTQNLIKQYNGNERLLSDVLEPLFFDTLNTKREGDIADPKLGDNIKIPYLNGGLFDKDKLDEKQIDFPYAYFAELMDFFSQYNFTIDENDPNDAEVGIDPEMLGHIFENLLEDNKDKGAFYTPKEIVQYMCRQSLIEYLQSKLGKHIEIESFINNHDTGDRLDGKNYIAANAKAIEELLDNVKICDPAIGSGAFPMGILNEIFHAKMALDMTLDRAAVKKNIIQNSIYGVDIEQGAVDIARLRFWLSLVVDDNEPQPLPNLDYKIMQGNSLLESFEGVDLSFYQEKGCVTQGAFDFDGASETQNELKRLIKEYFAVTDHTRKDALRMEIDEKVKEHIIKSCGHRPEIVEKVEAIDSTNRPFFLWHVYFADVFEQGGFDIVIGNPPYVESKLPNTCKTRYFTYKSNELYAYFFELAISYLLNNDGVISYITGSLYLKGIKFNSLRALITQSLKKPILIIAGDDVFTQVSMPTAILIGTKGCELWHFDDFIAGSKLIKKIDEQALILSNIALIQRGFEIGKDKTSMNSGDVEFITGADVDRYVVKRVRKISKEVFDIYCKSDYYFNGERLLIRETGSVLTVLFLEDELYSNRSLYSIKIDSKFNLNIKFVLGMLNSRLIQFYYSNKYKSDTNIFPKIRIHQVKNIPIVMIKEIAQQPFIELVDKILEAKKADPKADTTALEAQIDSMVYALYNLTEEEIKIIENKIL